ncbi:protein STRUBBELIG-RECEPTOR FAMILY 8 isoform X2 [Elaeis guineensis]|uniref:protein STRUBBELIG-RECEPTOR FAMILY 8 isoform X2 n=1 Tax=Elaeis guineensis var. tenera TaxID=51953 RepID=UPI00057B0256
MAAFAALAVLVVLCGSLAVVVESATDPSDVQALGVLYSSLNSPPQLSGWTSSGGDPCRDSWKGITCSGSAVTAIQVSGMGLNGTLGYLLSDLLSLKTLDISNNNLREGIPYQLPPNLTYLNLAKANLSGSLPFSISTMVSLNYFNLSHNSLSQQIGDIFANLQDLSELDISFNNLTGDLPNSLSSLSNLSSLYLQDNQLTGPEYCKQQFQWLDTTGIQFNSKSYKEKDDTRTNASHSRSVSIGADRATDKEMREQRLESASVTSLKPPPVEKMMVEKVYGKNGSGKKPKVPITATSYTVASLQIATNSFSQDSLLGEGSLGRVYRAEFSNGKVLAVKKIDSAALSLQEEDNYLEAVSSMSRLKHPNIVTLVGYCVEHGQRLLVYEYIGNATLHDMLHFADDSSTKVTWNARVRIALGTARALEYLHEVCLPSVVHRNFKSANILLDEELNPHLSDCGLAALTPNTERQVSTEVVGSFGYSAPEFAMSGIYTVKSDVYSFGVVMLELLTGRKPLDSSRERSEQSLVRWATPQLHDIDALAKMVDPALNGMYPAKSLSRFADIIALCVQPEPEFRPPMSEVVQQLVRLMQRASIVRRSSGDELGYSYRISEHEASTTDMSF